MAIFNTVYGGEWKWKPWSNTLLYLPLNQNANDETGNYTITNSNVTFSDNYAVFNGSSAKLVSTSNIALTWNPSFTFSMWIYHTRTNTDVIFGIWPRSAWKVVWIFLDSSKINIWKYNSWDISTTATVATNTWINLIMTSDWTTTKIYSNWILIYNSNITYDIWSWILMVWANSFDNSNYWWWRISKFILENKTWSENEITKYYNSTKANYS